MGPADLRLIQAGRSVMEIGLPISRRQCPEGTW
jgi:hypothetical protein